jgi:hypothetical protein
MIVSIVTMVVGAVNRSAAQEIVANKRGETYIGLQESFWRFNILDGKNHRAIDNFIGPVKSVREYFVCHQPPSYGCGDTRDSMYDILETGYNQKGFRVAVFEYAQPSPAYRWDYSNDGRLKFYCDNVWHRFHTYGYDVKGRVVGDTLMTQSESGTDKYYIIRYVRNAKGQIVQSFGIGKSSKAEELLSEYKYDGAGRVISVADAGSSGAHVIRDKSGRIIRLAMGATAWIFEYGAFGSFKIWSTGDPAHSDNIAEIDSKGDVSWAPDSASGGVEFDVDDRGNWIRMRSFQRKYNFGKEYREYKPEENIRVIEYYSENDKDLTADEMQRNRRLRSMVVGGGQ